jgi:hypothetical protein
MLALLPYQAKILAWIFRLSSMGSLEDNQRTFVV